jgi:D-alanine-D-alanine ligase
MNARFGKVAVLMGGDSAEREISLESGSAVLAALLRQGVRAEGLDLNGQVLGRLQAEGFDRVFIALHGRGGEDGQIQGALETLRIPYTGSGILASALAMDKRMSKRVWLSLGLPTPPFLELGQGFDPEAVVEAVGLPIMVKPAREGSSVGASKVTAKDALTEAWRQAARTDDCVIAERWITGKEYTVAVLGAEALPIIRLETPRAFYDYEAKYLDDQTRYLIPSGLSEDRERVTQSLALRAFHALGCRGWGRVDLMIDGQDQPWLLEVNTVPGMTSHSLVPMAAKAAGIGFDELVLRILEMSLAGDMEAKAPEGRT